MKAESYINAGYQRLLTFEVPGGGFDWVGGPPAKNVLTAYGILELVDMGRVFPVDRGIVERAKALLLSRQNHDGSWSLDYPVCTWTGVQSALPVTAYVAWSLVEAGERGAAVDRALSFVRRHVADARDPYVLALCANALASAEPDGRVTRIVLRRLLNAATTADGAVYWPLSGQTLTYSKGQTEHSYRTTLFF